MESFMDANPDFLVQFKNVQKSYDGVHLVVKDFNVDMVKGEFLTMLGPSGSGKTTCLMMLAGFETATSGQIMLDGQSINNVAPHKRDIGMVFQNYALFPHMTVAENLAFPLQVRKMNKSEITEKVNHALKMVRLDHFANRRPAQLSGGQQQRVAVARALVFEPKLVLMDEPLGALDKNLREEMQYEIKHIHEDLGVTMLYVTHDQVEALTMSDRIAVFDDGIVQQLASPHKLYDEPTNAFVANFIGENNRLMGKVVSVDGENCAVELAGGGGLVQAKKINVDGVGSETTLSLRPERVIVNPGEGECANTCGAMVEELIYHGDHTRTRVSVSGNTDFIIKVPNTHNQEHMKKGESIKIGWNTDDCRALDA
jgi:putative spermidine/putrescine transport system ATP-binding protein